MKAIGSSSTIVGLVIAGLASVPAQAKAPSIFDMFDSAVISMVATGKCHAADQATLSRYTHQFKTIYGQVEDELMAMNPGKTRGQVQMLIGFRTAQLELRTEKSIAHLGCDHPDVKQAARLLDIKTERNM